MVAVLILDLGLFQKSGAEPSFRKSALLTLFYVALAGCFGLWIWSSMGAELAMQFYAGYIVEQSLSMDNLFVFILIFQNFKVPPQLQRRVLFWGIIGALLMRAIFIFFGIALLQHLHWMIYVFGAVLIWAGYKSLRTKEDDEESFTPPAFLRRLKRITDAFHEHRFVVLHNGKWHGTPLLLTLITVEISDVVFAIDSIPAVLSISKDPFIVYSSNIFAILGLRSLFFVIAGLMKYLHYLNVGLGLILMFVGSKMLLDGTIHVSIATSLSVIMGILTVTLIASLLKSRASEKATDKGNSDGRQG